MKITVLTLFPEMYEGFLNSSIIRRIIEKKLCEVKVIDIRNYSKDKHHHVDDTPYGGMAGMLMKVDVVHEALLNNKSDNSYVMLTSPKARPLKQEDLIRFSTMEDIVFICGHYEGIDSRIEKYVDQNISIGDYILTGGELASMVVMDGIMRLLDEGISSDSLKEESYNSSLLEYPQYTRPVEYDGQRVPDVLMSGNHEKIRQYNLKESLRETLKYRPDLLKNKELNKEEKKFLEEIKNEINSCL